MDHDRPLGSLQSGQWFKLICGASYQYLPAIRNLTLAYTLAGADCIDLAADPAVIQAGWEGLEAAAQLTQAGKNPIDNIPGLPWLMISLNDGTDPHFRKAYFEPQGCLEDCSQPCVSICPAQAISLDQSDSGYAGVLDHRCYGCGRCLPVCPIQQIETRSHHYSLEQIGQLLRGNQIDALEIHTQVGRAQAFQHLWQGIAAHAHRLKLVAVSCPDGEGLVDYLWQLHQILSPLPCPLVWQTDGRPMSGDIGDGTTRAAIKLGEKVLKAKLPGYVQLAGGTNRHTVAKLKAADLLVSGSEGIAGVAYGSFARTLLAPVLEQLEQIHPREGFPESPNLEDWPELLIEAVALARSLVSQLKRSNQEVNHLTPEFKPLDSVLEPCIEVGYAPYKPRF